MASTICSTGTTLHGTYSANILPGARSETVPVPELDCIMALAIMFT